RHVILRGRIGPFITVGPHPGLEPRAHREFRESTEAFHRDVDWALDISAAEFTDVGIHMVPGDLVRRDPEAEFPLRRETVRAVDRQQLPGIVALVADRFDDIPFDSLVYPVPTLNKNFDQLLDEFEQARAAGLAE